MNRLVLVSNRLPVTVEKRKNDFNLKHSIGGLATGLASFYQQQESLWVGWCGLSSNSLDASKRAELESVLQRSYNSLPTFLSKRDEREFYAGFCNKTIWPLFHYFANYTSYSSKNWNAYKRVNKHFAQTILKVLRPDDILWIHDYHLLLLPGLLRREMPDIRIGFFLHIPFPSYEIFRLLPWRQEILEGMLGADLIGFHTYDYVRHFDSSVRRILGHEHVLGQIIADHRIISVDAFPMGIDFDKFAEAEIDASLYNEIQLRIKDKSSQKIILSVDRLDYTKGIPERLEAFDYFLEKNPEYRGKVTLIMVAVPSRTSVETYMELKGSVDELVGRINGKYSAPDWMPVWYYYRAVPFKRLSSLYNLAHVALVTPVRDGMNLIAKEYIAAKKDDTGVLILSEMAGAASELGESLIVNPNNKAQIADALKTALEMSTEEQIERNRLMKKRLKRYGITEWAEDFISRLKESQTEKMGIAAKRMDTKKRSDVLQAYKESSKRLILLDYDGTLVPFCNKPVKAAPDEELLDILGKLCSDDKNHLIIISGRDKEILEKWFGNMNIEMSAEHGVWMRNRDRDWHMLEHVRDEWKQKIRPVLELFTDRTPGSFIEEKSHSLAWHYRNTSIEMGSVRSRELKEGLLHFITNLDLQVMEGNKVLEIKNSNVNKGRAALYWVSQKEWPFILAMGDDYTDEYVFIEMPENAYTIKIGLEMTRARYYLKDYAAAREMLQSMADLS